MIPTQKQVERLNTEFVFYGFGTNYTIDTVLVFDTIEQVLEHFTDGKTVYNFGCSADIEMWLEENYGDIIYYSDTQSMYFVIK